MNLNTPKPFTPQAGRIGKDWQLWKKEFMYFLKLSGGYENLSEEHRAYLLLNLMGAEGIKAKEMMTFDHPNEENDMDILIMKFDEIFDPSLNEAEERYKFHSRRKRENETIENFVADLKEKAETCNFGEQCNKFIIDKIVCSADNYLREIIFSLNDVKVADLMQYWNQYSANTEKIKEISKNLSKEETSNEKPQQRNCWRCNTRHKLGYCPAYGTKCNVCNEINHFNGLCKKESTNSQKTEISHKRICSKCGTNHPYKQCPAFDYICFKCRTKGHYENKCKNAPDDSIKKDEQIKETRETKSKPTISQNKQKGTKSNSTVKQSEQKDFQHCLWCESKHIQGQCPHNPHCTTCNKFPHNICFNCKKNPHKITCYYKSVITLPAKRLSASSSAQQTSSRTENKNHENLSNKSSTPSPYCNLCLKYGDHTSHNCPRALNNIQRPTLQSATTDPLLKDYVKINQNTPSSVPRSTPTSAYNQRSTSHSYGTKPYNNYRNNSQYHNNNYKKNNEKSDSCCIS